MSGGALSSTTGDTGSTGATVDSREIVLVAVNRGEMTIECPVAQMERIEELLTVAMAAADEPADLIRKLCGPNLSSLPQHLVTMISMGTGHLRHSRDVVSALLARYAAVLPVKRQEGQPKAWARHRFSGKDEATNWAIDHLRLLGFSVTLPTAAGGSEETPGEFQGRLGISATHFSRRIKHIDCPKFEHTAGPSGRILKLRSNPDFEAFMKPQKGAKDAKGNGGMTS